jgi:hypothetical protein
MEREAKLRETARYQSQMGLRQETMSDLNGSKLSPGQTRIQTGIPRRYRGNP